MSDLETWLQDPSRNPPKPGTYIVIRVLPSYPYQVPADLDGKWYDLASIMSVLMPRMKRGPGVVTAWETGRFETRDDGAVAQVFEIRGRP